MARGFEIWCACPGCGHIEYHVFELKPAEQVPASRWRAVEHTFNPELANKRRPWVQRGCLKCRTTWEEQEPSPVRAWLDAQP